MHYIMLTFLHNPSETICISNSLLTTDYFVLFGVTVIQLKLNHFISSVMHTRSVREWIKLG